MRVWVCGRCGHRVPFAVQECGTCGAALGYVSEDRTVRVLLPSNDQATYEVVGHDGLWWRCMNSAWGCNWALEGGIPGKKSGPPEDLVGTLLLLCSSAGAWINGQSILVDGGWVMRL